MRDAQPKVGILNYGIGNVGSLYSALRFFNQSTYVVNDARKIKEYDIIVLSGVGNFSAAVKKLKKGGFWEEILEYVTYKNKPILGICLGMQMFASKSYEGGEYEGFGFIDGSVVRMEVLNEKLPRIGWFSLSFPKENPIFNGLRYGNFYFMHSYHFLPKDENSVIAVSKYGNLNVVSAVMSFNIVGLQFHPEKSQGDGLRVLRNAMRYLSNV